MAGPRGDGARVGSAVKPREERQKVMIQARMRSGVSWRDVAGHDRSRWIGRAMEFVCFVQVAGAVALTAFGSVEQALARPLSQISAALG